MTMTKRTAARGALVVGLAAALLGSVTVGSAFADGDGPLCSAAFAPAVQSEDGLTFTIGLIASCETAATEIGLDYSALVIDDDGGLTGVENYGPSFFQSENSAVAEPPDIRASTRSACFSTDEPDARVLGHVLIHAYYPDGTEFYGPAIDGPPTTISC